MDKKENPITKETIIYAFDNVRKLLSFFPRSCIDKHADAYTLSYGCA